MSIRTYTSMRAKGDVVPSGVAFDIARGECNLGLIARLIDIVAKNKGMPQVIWEPFAGHTGKSHGQDAAARAGVRLISYDIEPSDDRVIRADSRLTGPNETVGGMFFHPPYFGSSPMSADPMDISRITDWAEYVSALRRVVCIAMPMISGGGTVCAVGRDYRHGGNRVRLDHEMVSMFEFGGFFEICGVVIGEPDVGILFKKVG